MRPHSVVFRDGSELPADLIVYATGYQSMNRWLAQIISEEAAKTVGPCWGYGSGTPGDPGGAFGRRSSVGQGHRGTLYGFCGLRGNGACDGPFDPGPR